MVRIDLQRFGGRGAASKAGGQVASATAERPQVQTTQEDTLRMKSTVTLKRDFDEWVKTVDPNDFLIYSERTGEHLLSDMAMPETVKIGDTTFDYISSSRSWNEKGDPIFVINYQSRDKIVYANSEALYPILDIGLKSHVTPSGKLKRSVVRTGTWRTKLE